MNKGTMMNTESKEHLSQLMDGELGGETGRFVLRRLAASTELRGTWARYHMIRDCMRYQDRSFADSALSTRVREAIDEFGVSAGQVAAASAGGRRWLRPVAGFAVAATVAAMAVIAVGPYLPGGNGAEAQQASVTETQPFTSPNILSSGPISRQVNFNGGDEPAARKMNSYLLRHYQVAGASGGNGFVSFVPIVISKSATQRPAEADAEAQERSEQASDRNSQ